MDVYAYVCIKDIAKFKHIVKVILKGKIEIKENFKCKINPLAPEACLK